MANVLLNAAGKAEVDGSSEYIPNEIHSYTISFSLEIIDQ